jgi:hypothetical protein
MVSGFSFFEGRRLERRDLPVQTGTFPEWTNCFPHASQEGEIKARASKYLFDLPSLILRALWQIFNNKKSFFDI